MKITHQLVALVVAFIWGTNFVLIKLGLAELPPFLFAALRFLLVAIPLIFVLPRPKVAWRWIVAYGVLIGFGQFGLLFWAMQGHITPGLASLVIQMQVFFTIFLAVYIFQEKLQAAQIAALIISGTGLGLIIFYTDGDTSLLELAVVLVAALSWAGANLVVKHVGSVSIIAFIAWSSIFAVPPLLIMSLIFEGVDSMADAIMSASLGVWGIVLWQTIGNTLLGYGLWNICCSTNTMLRK